jgi:hypothetical protein
MLLTPPPPPPPPFIGEEVSDLEPILVPSSRDGFQEVLSGLVLEAALSAPSIRATLRPYKVLAR